MLLAICMRVKTATENIVAIAAARKTNPTTMTIAAPRASPRRSSLAPAKEWVLMLVKEACQVHEIAAKKDRPVTSSS